VYLKLLPRPTARILGKIILIGAGVISPITSSVWAEQSPAPTITVFANASSGVNVDELTLGNLRAIFSVRKRSWDNDLPIKVFVLADQEPLHQEFCKTILKIYPYVLREQWDRLTFSGTGIPPTVVGSEEQLRQAIANTPGAIGYVMSQPKILVNSIDTHYRLFVSNSPVGGEE
jgi:hypothetical protein